MKRTCKLFRLSSAPIDYARAWGYQKCLMESCRLSRSDPNGGSAHDSLLVVQHDSVYTIGKGADLSNLKFNAGTPGNPPVYKIERGGDVTWHGPGQLVFYPIVDLNCHKRDLHWYVRTIEQVVIDVLQAHGVEGRRDPINSGVFVNNNKISAVGITASRWITMHGVALNVTCDMSNFGKIVPCGIDHPAFGVTRLQDQVSKPLSPAEVTNEMIHSLGKHFNLEFSEVDRPQEALDALLMEHPDISASRPPAQHSGN